ncbi:MAG: hypothetical protein Q8S18_02750 [Bacteroidales bacterium]|nr:hypothetical protein [Bacteroidales bacterium]
MKKHVFVLVIAILFLNNVKGQECVYCPQEPISATASNIGPYTEAAGSSSIAMGIYSTTTSNASNSFAMGVYVKSAMSYNFVIGTGVNGSNYLVNNLQRSLMIGFGSTKPTFFVGTSPSSVATGRIGIGDVTAPQAKLHIKADTDEPATLKLEATGTSGDNVFSRMLFTPNHSIQAADNQNFTFSTQSTKHFVFQNGNVGIGMADPLKALDVQGDVRASGSFFIGDNPIRSSQWENSGNRIFYNGNVGIGTNDPKERLSVDASWGRPINFHIGGSQNIYSNAYYEGVDKRAKEGPAYSINFSDTHMAIRVAVDGAADSQISWTEVINFNSEGEIGIGTNITNGYKLAVAGKIIAQEMRIVFTVPESDFVFKPNYPLMPLNELKAFISTNNHLPEVPSATEFKENGYSVGTMDDLLLRKIEELTLYILQQQEEIERLKEFVENNQ